jgi:hypothetical protein
MLKSLSLCLYSSNLGVVLNYETKSKRNERNETKRNEILRNATKFTKLRNEYNETKYTKVRNAIERNGI